MNWLRKMVISLSKAVLALLGISVVGCATSDDVVVMYGCPTADYTVSGKVTNEKGEPLKGIVVSQNYAEWLSGFLTLEDLYPYYFETVTGDDGAFVMNVKAMEAPDSLYAIDIDGPENGGKYLSARVKLEMEQVKEADGDAWYIGGFEAKNVDFQMKLEPSDAPDPQ